MIHSPITCDVLVIGSGGAGLYSAISAAEQGAKVVLATKGKVNRSGATLLAGANISADVMCDGKTLCDLGVPTGDPNDSMDKWYADIIHEGFYLNDRDLVAQYVEQAAVCVSKMLTDGVRLTDASEGGRQIGVPGSAILDWLYRRVTSLGVEVLQDVMLCDLLKSGDGSAAGALLLDIASGELMAVSAGATVLATGGMHNCYTFNSGTTGLFGEGQAAAMRLGADMTLMEMVTFCPDVICAPEKYRGNILPYILQCCGFGELFNGRGEPFLHKYMSQSAEQLALNTEWNKLLLCYAMHQEVHAGLGDTHGGIRFTIANLEPERRQQLFDMLPQLNTGLYKEILAYHDTNGGLSVYAAGHYFDGGIKVDKHMATNIPGLFAAGECTGGLFGANRVAAATVQMMVQGCQAGLSAASFVKAAGQRTPDSAWLEHVSAEALSPFIWESGEAPRKLRKSISAIVSESAGVIRNEQDLLKGLSDLKELADCRVKLSVRGHMYNREWMDWLESRSMRLCGEAIIKSSLARKESRGVFIRSDHFYTDDDNYLAATVLHNGEVTLQQVRQDAITCPAGRHEYIQNLEDVIGRLSYSVEGV